MHGLGDVGLPAALAFAAHFASRPAEGIEKEGSHFRIRQLNGAGPFGQAGIFFFRSGGKIHGVGQLFGGQPFERIMSEIHVGAIRLVVGSRRRAKLVSP